MRSKEVDFAKGSCAYNILLNLWRNQDHLVFQGRSLGHFLKEEEEDGEFDRISDWTFVVHLQYSKHIFS